jgi:hypothetical protein
MAIASSTSDPQLKPSEKGNSTMTIRSQTTLRPGLLVSLKTSVTGNVEYFKQTIEADHDTEEGKRKARWETERTISDPVEHEAALKVRSRALTLIRGVCSRSAFGLLCPEIMTDKLDRAVAQARELADEFNKTATLTTVSIYVITGRIAPDDVEAVKAINAEVRELLEDMDRGLRRLDVDAVRDAANRARNIGAMLSPDAAARINVAIEAARGAARRMVRAGEQAANELDRATLARIEEARTAFLDLDEAGEIEAPEAEGRAVDLLPTAPIGKPVATANALEI